VDIGAYQWLLLVAIGSYSIGGYWCLLMVIILMAIGGYSISGYCCLLMIIILILVDICYWILVVIVL